MQQLDYNLLFRWFSCPAHLGRGAAVLDARPLDLKLERARTACGDGPSPPERCGIIGGATYRATAAPAWRGVYVFGDLCSGEFWALRKPGPDAEVRMLMDSEATPVAIVEGPKGELLVVDGPGGALHRLHLPASAENSWRSAQAAVEETALQARRSGFSFTQEQLEQERAQRKFMLASKRWRYTEPLAQLYHWLRRPPD